MIPSQHRPCACERLEILAPAGGHEQLLAAVRCGADAVYLGAKGFNARQNAENFTEKSLAEAVSFCHARGVRVYVTVNTLITDDELPALLDTLREVAASGADAAIVQDLAVAKIVRACCPDIALHASTQMTIHNAAGAQMLEALGFTRVVLARELTLAEIARIHTQTALELEAFVHGALCMSVSGACYLSSMLGGRSGNRGRCAQPCRLDFRCNEKGHALSLKDLSALAHLEALQAAGVRALKIEGRMKRPEYVAAAVTACKQACRGEPYDLQTLQDVFSRGGFTDGYLTGKRGPAMFGIRSEADAQASQRAQRQLTGLYQHERAAVPVDMTLSMAAGRPSLLAATDGIHTVQARGDIPQPAMHAPTDEARAWRSLSRTGDSPFLLRSLALDSDGTQVLSAAALNALRREALGALLARREVPKPHPFLTAGLPGPLPRYTPPAKPALHIRLQTSGQLWEGLDADRLILPAEAVTAALLAQHGERLIAEMPALIFPEEEAAALGRLQKLRDQGLRGALCHNLGAIRMAKEAGLAVHGGYGLNILNSHALAAYADMGLADATVSFELHARKIDSLSGILPRGMLAYGHLPLMQLRSCPALGKAGCGQCDGHPVLTDRTGTSFPLLCRQRRYATLLNSVPLSLSGDPPCAVDFVVLAFTFEPAPECRRVWEAFKRGDPLQGGRTRGLYHRTLQ